MLFNKLKQLKENIKKTKTNKKSNYKKILAKFDKQIGSDYLDLKEPKFEDVLEYISTTVFNTKAILTVDLIGYSELLNFKDYVDEYDFKKNSISLATEDNLEDTLINSGFIDELFSDTIDIPYCDDPEYQISTHFKLKDFIRSASAARLGIPNLPNEREFKNICAVARALEIIWQEFGPIRIGSGFRCPRVNEAVGGSKTSDHMHGAAADIISPSDSESSNKKLYYTVKRLHESGVLNTRQIIWEYGTSEGPDWVHVAVKHSYAPNLSANHILAIGNKAGNAYLLNA